MLTTRAIEDVSELWPKKWACYLPVCLSAGIHRSLSGRYISQGNAKCLRVDSSRPDCLKVSRVTKDVKEEAEGRQ
jgi:hypothetical protein